MYMVYMYIHMHVCVCECISLLVGWLVCFTAYQPFPGHLTGN